MDIVIKSTAAAITGALLCILIKKHNPEISYALSTLMTVSVLLTISSMFTPVKELIQSADSMLGASSALIKPLLKCMAIAFISKFGADICKDASQNALASAIELGGTLCAAGAAGPMILSTLKSIGAII